MQSCASLLQEIVGNCREIDVLLVLKKELKERKLIEIKEQMNLVF